MHPARRSRATRPTQEAALTEPLYVARSTITKVAGVHRRGRLEDGTVIEFGVHGNIKQHFRLDSEKNLPLPVDYIAAATGA
jgi:hypothetical protein